MVFSSLLFLYIFLPICLIIYYAVPTIRLKNTVLLIMSLVFYAWGEPKWIVLMIAGTAVHYFGGILISRTKNKKIKKAVLGVCIAISLALLAIFKYYNFFITEFNSLFNSSISTLKLTLPIGISFYTFQTITYTVDVYRNRAKAQTSFFKLLLYVCMFPQLIAGPIVKYVDIEKAFDHRTIKFSDISDGIVRFIIGLFKKAVLANFFGKAVSDFLEGDLWTSAKAGVWVGVIFYAFQIYFDFSAYSDMAIGLGKMLGFKFPENFKYPYVAADINDFWKRWHISLTTFFREYLYIPLGGNRKNHVFNLFLVWLLTGLWHGSAVNFILWGLYYFVFIAMETFFFDKFRKRRSFLFKQTIGRVYTLFVVLIGWVFFYFDDMVRLKTALTIMFTNISSNSLIDVSTYLQGRIFLILIAVIACTPIPKMILEKTQKAMAKTDIGKIVSDIAIGIFSLILMILSTACLVGTTYNPFLYFRF